MFSFKEKKKERAMKKKSYTFKRIVTSFGVALIIACPTPLMSQETAAEVTDIQGNLINLTKITTNELPFSRIDNVIRIPIILISEIKSLGRDDLFEVVLLSGEVIKGSSKSTFKGEWEFGAYSVDLTKIRNITFIHDKSSSGGMSEWKQPHGFVAKVNGTKVYGLECEFAYDAWDTNWMPSKHYVRYHSLLYLVVFRLDSLYFIPFSKIKKALPGELILKNDSKVAVRLNSYKDSDISTFYKIDEINISGVTSCGKIEWPIEKIKSMDFIHDEDLHVSFDKEKYRYHPNLQFTKSVLNGTIITKSGLTIDVTQLWCMQMNFDDIYWFGFEHRIIDSMLGIVVGEAMSEVELSKIKAIKEFDAQISQDEYDKRVTSLTAKLTSTSGNTISVNFNNSLLCFGGKTDLGFVVVFAPFFNSVEVK